MKFNQEKKMLLFHLSFFGFRQPIAAPTATPTDIHTGSLVAAKTAAPIAVPTPIQFPTLSEFSNSLLILCRQFYLLHRNGLEFIIPMNLSFFTFANGTEIEKQTRLQFLISNLLS